MLLIVKSKIRIWLEDQSSRMMRQYTKIQGVLLLIFIQEKHVSSSNDLASAEKRANIPYTYRWHFGGKFGSHKQSRVY